MKEEKKSAFAVLSAINCNGHTEKKNGLTYLSWAWAWQMVKENFPDAAYTIYENADGLFYHTDGQTAWVKTGVTIEGIEHIEYLPVMDFRNQSIPVAKVTSFDVNKTIQRSLTKACARHGLGLYIYAGEDLPSDGSMQQVAEKLDKGFGAVAELTDDIKAEINEAETTTDFSNIKTKYLNTAYNKPVQESLYLHGVQLGLWSEAEAKKYINKIK